MVIDESAVKPISTFTFGAKQLMETIAGHLYDFPKYYDLIFGSDWAAEFNFLNRH